MSIKRKLTLTIMGISLIAVVLTVGAITAYLIYDMRKEKIQELSVTASITGDRNRAGLMFLDNARVQENLEIFRLNPAILVACIYNAEGALFASYRGDSASALVCPSLALETRRALPGMLSAREPIRQNDEVVGTMFMVSDTSAIDAYVQKIILISGTVASFVMICTLLLTFYFQRTISGPILELANTAQSITASRNYNLAAKTIYSDETGILANAFNEMLQEVRKRDHELTHANETLEEKVSLRTHQLEESKRKAEAASEAKSEFLRNMSHEFRTPLHAITSFSTYGIKEIKTANSDQLKQYFDMIHKGSERLCHMVNEVLDLAKLEHGDLVLSPKRTDLCQLATQAVDLMRPLIQEKNITLFTEHLREGAPVICDHDKIIQVITNVLGNAIKFTPAGKHITLRTEIVSASGGLHYALSVIDEGLGIPEGETETIFESFRQSSRTNTGAGGTGLGLAICRGIVLAHGGRIWAENNEGTQGARVSFLLPLPKTETRPVGVHHDHAA